MPKTTKTSSASHRAANPTLKDAFTGQSEASYSKVKSDARALSFEIDGNVIP